MEENEAENTDEVSVTIELTGNYADVVTKLRDSEVGDQYLDSVTHDLSILLETLGRMGGGTRSAIAEELPDDMIVEHDAEDVVTVMNVLAKYNLVRLEGNTWKPGESLPST